jgi:parallel beta-helix repeat protein
MKYTENYNLKKPEAEDFYNVEDFNDNADIIDGKLKNLKDNLESHKAESASHVKPARIVVGTSTSGWTEKDCDYLCDGTNDQVEINNAIAALPATGGEVIILDGTYNITARINVNKNNVSIRGNGNATVLKRMWNSSFSEGIITLTSVQGCRIENLQIDGNKTTYTSNYNYAIRLHSSNNNNTVTGNTCNNNYHGIHLSSSSNNTVTNNTCNNNEHGIRLDSSSNNTVTGNTCNNNNNGIFLDSSSNNTVTSNTCNNNNNGIRLNSSSSNTITGNTCYNNYYGIHPSSSSNNIIAANTCIRGIGTPEDYSTSQRTILLSGTDNNYNLITSNNCMGQAPVVEGGTGNTVFNNKWDASDDIQNIEEQINIAESAAKSYTDAHENKTSTHGATATPTASRIAMYDSSGRLSSGAAPTSDNHVVRKVDFDSHINSNSAHSATATPTASRIAMYDSGKRLSSGAAPSNDNHVIRKVDIDNIQQVDFTRGTAYVIRNFVHLHISGGEDVGGTIVTRLPSSIRPITDICGVAFTSGAGIPFGSSSKLFFIDTEGYVYCYNKSLGEDVYISAFYIKG